MADVARRAGVDRSTVSLALRHQPRIPASTRERVLAAAAALGYAPDPLLGAFNHHRVTARAPRPRLGIGFISDFPTRSAFDRSELHREALAGATDAAARLGFVVALLLTGPGQLSPARLDAVLHSRGIPAVILGALGLATSALPLTWPRYVAVAIESFHLQPRLHCLSLDHRAAARATLARLVQQGHRRIGFVASRTESERIQHMALAGYLLEQSRRKLPRIPPLLLASPDAAATLAAAWHRRLRPTAVIVDSLVTRHLLASQLGRHADDLAWVSPLAAEKNPDRLQATEAPFRQLGAHAVELVALRLQIGARGLPEDRSTLLLPPKPPLL